MKFSGKVGNGTMNKLLHFGGNQDHGSWHRSEFGSVSQHW